MYTYIYICFNNFPRVASLVFDSTPQNRLDEMALCESNGIQYPVASIQYLNVILNPNLNLAVFVKETLMKPKEQPN
jgi:hypothetical protein